MSHRRNKTKVTIYPDGIIDVYERRWHNDIAIKRHYQRTKSATWIERFFEEDKKPVVRYVPPYQTKKLDRYVLTYIENCHRRQNRLKKA